MQGGMNVQESYSRALEQGTLLTAWQRERERERESSHQEGTVGGEVPSLVLKVCIKAKGERMVHAAAVHAWVFSFEEEVNEGGGGRTDHYKSSRMTSRAMLVA